MTLGEHVDDLYRKAEKARKREREQLESQNEKLRGLVTEMHDFITSLPSSVRDYDDPLGNWEYTMQGLGMEVGE